MSVPTSPIAINEQFQLLYGALRFYQSSAFEFAIKTNGAFLVVIGWIVTSGKARDFLGTRDSIRTLGALLLAVCSVLYGVLTWRTYTAAADVAQQIALLNAANPAIYHHAILMESSTMALIGANAGIAAICIVILLTVSAPTPAGPVAR